MEMRPHGREKHITGQGKEVRKGESVSGGPVGRREGYEGRIDRPTESTSGASGSGSQTTRAGGRSPIFIIIALAILLLGGGGAGLSSLLGGGSGTDVTDSGVGTLLSTLVGGTGSFAGGGVSTGWVEGNNTGKLNTSVAEGAREKYTQLFGNGQDTVTLMVYMCGTDLESKNGMATADIGEMTKANLSDKVNVLVFTGGCKQWQNNVVSNKCNQIYKVEKGGLRPLEQNAGNAAMTKPSTLADFIQYSKDRFPASRYGLILWDHGSGSVSGYGYDEKNQMAGSMGLKGISEALKTGGVKFDFVGFDACLMATLETGLTVEPYADYMIASEETEPGVGWYYTDFLTALSENTSMPTTELGKKIADDFVAACSKQCPGQKTTLSLTDLAELRATVPEKFTGFATSTSNLLQKDGYKKVADARAGTREFAVSNRLDQMDLAHFAYNLGTEEGKSLAEAVRGAVKYNKTSSNMTNAYGLSVYFPYKSTGKVDTAAASLEAAGLDAEYTRCIRQFASMEVGGQAASGGSGSPFESLFGTGGQTGGGSAAELLGNLMGGDLTGTGGLTSGNSSFLEELFTMDRAVSYIEKYSLDPSKLVWEKEGSGYGIRLSEEEWSLVHDLALGLFIDDGEGYLDMGLDNVFTFSENGVLLGEYDGTWLAIDGQPVAYYYEDSVYDGEEYTVTGRIPVLLNGERANLLVVFDKGHPYGGIVGARTEYTLGETETVAKSVTELQKGDVIRFVCDYYSYDGAYQASYAFGDPLTYTGDHEISNVYLTQNDYTAAYLFTDLYHREFWTPAIP